MPDFPSAVAALPELPKYTEQDFLDLFSRLLPDHYLEPLQDPGPGYELLEAYAAMAARMSEAVSHVGTGNYIMSAGEGSYAEGEVEFFRTDTVWGAVTLLPGTVVASADGYTYTTLDTVTFGATDLGPISTRVRATVRGWLYNKPGPVTCADTSVIPGTVNLLVRPELGTSENFDPTLQLRQTTDITGGSSPMLQGLGADRGLPQEPDESIEDYRARLTKLPDTVTPAALLAQFMTIVGNRLDRLGYRWWFVECWDLRFQTGWDHPKNEFVSPSNDVLQYAPTNTQITNFVENVFVWDYDPRTMPAAVDLAPSGWAVSNRLLDAGEYSSAIIIAIPRIASLQNWYAALARTLTAIKPAGISIYYVFST